MTESESVALPLGDAALLANAPHYSRFPRACQELLKKITEFSVNYRNFHQLWEWVVAEMPGQCAGAWTANDHTAKALNHKQQYIMETAKSQCILPIWAGSRSAFSRKLLLCDADCAIFLLRSPSQSAFPVPDGIKKCAPGGYHLCRSSLLPSPEEESGGKGTEFADGHMGAGVSACFPHRLPGKPP